MTIKLTLDFYQPVGGQTGTSCGGETPQKKKLLFVKFAKRKRTKKNSEGLAPPDCSFCMALDIDGHPRPDQNLLGCRFHGKIQSKISCYTRITREGLKSIQNLDSRSLRLFWVAKAINDQCIRRLIFFLFSICFFMSLLTILAKYISLQFGPSLFEIRFDSL